MTAGSRGGGFGGAGSVGRDVNTDHLVFSIVQVPVREVAMTQESVLIEVLSDRRRYLPS